jgi:hypothetical protein
VIWEEKRNYRLGSGKNVGSGAGFFLNLLTLSAPLVQFGRFGIRFYCFDDWFKMRALTFFLFLCSLCLFVDEARSGLLISEYIEGSGDNKGIEIWNNSETNVNLTGVRLEVYIDGSAGPTSTIFLATGFILAAGDVFVLCHPSASFAGSADQTSFSAAWTGNDAIVLRVGGIVQDSIGQVGFAPENEWGTNMISTADNTLRRVPGNTVGDTDPHDVYDPSAIFQEFPIDDFSHLGVAPTLLRFKIGASLTISNDFFHAHLTGPVNSSVVLDGSVNLQNWTPIQTNLCTTNGINVSIPLGTNAFRFFRARVP